MVCQWDSGGEGDKVGGKDAVCKSGKEWGERGWQSV